MLIRTTHVALALMLVVQHARADGPAAKPAAAVKAAVQKSLPLLQESAATYTDQRDCFSCHHQALPAMTIDLARRYGYEVDRELAAEQAEFTLEYFYGRIDEVREGKGVPGGPFTAGYALISLHVEDRKPDETIGALVTYLLKTQKKDGSWRIRTHRPPLEDSHFTATALSLRGLKLYASEEQADELADRTRRARKWLVDTKPRTNEDRIMRLLGLKWSGADELPIKQAVDDLLEQQRDDGGWAQKSDMASDAYATGQALVAVHQAGGLPTDQAAYRRGIEYLLKTQHPDGSWLVKTRSKAIQKYFESGFPHGKSQFISISGASWATMALLLTTESTAKGP